VIEEKRIYVVVAGTIQGWRNARVVLQPAGRQIAQACHVVSKLRIRPAQLDAMDRLERDLGLPDFEPVTTIILQARDTAELFHVKCLASKKKLNPVTFYDNNSEYGPGEYATAIAFYATKMQTVFICDYLPMWGAK
jgi:hypothetical protein